MKSYFISYLFCLIMLIGILQVKRQCFRANVLGRSNCSNVQSLHKKEIGNPNGILFNDPSNPLLSL